MLTLTAQRTTEEWETLLRQERAARLAAEAALRMKDDFLPYISHDLRTPLTAILLWSRILRAGKMDEAGRRDAAGIIERCANEQSQLIEDVLDVFRMHTGKLRLNLRDIPLAPVVEAAIESFRPMAATKGVAISLEPGAHAGRVLGDAVRLQRVVVNLLAGAVRSIDSGGLVKVTLGSAGGHLHLIVTDHGSGFTPEVIRHVFDPFWREEVDGVYKSGRGLGLAVARLLVTLHNGVIDVHSDGEGRGATFTVKFPEIAGAENPAGVPGGIRFAESKLLNEVSILLVDDDPDTRDVTQWLLEQAGATVAAAGSGAEALDLFAAREGRSFHILLCDISGPDRHSYELLREIRKIETEQKARSDLRAVAMSVEAGDEERRLALEAGYCAYIVKPIKPAGLLTILAGISAQPT